MSTAFNTGRDILALIGAIALLLLATLVTFSYAEYWLSRRRERHLDEIERAEAARRQYLQRAVDQASQRNGGAEL
jgi:hypothetical protein